MEAFSVDRFEEETAVCLREDGSYVHILRKALPDGVREGSVLRLADGKWTLCEAQAERLRAENFALQESLFDE